MELSGNCPICDAVVSAAEDVEESEILSCSDCQSLLVVDRVDTTTFCLKEAPNIEEDWGQ